MIEENKSKARPSTKARKSNKAPWLDDKFSPKTKESLGDVAVPRTETHNAAEEGLAVPSSSDQMAGDWQPMEDVTPVVEDVVEEPSNPARIEEVR